MPAVGNALSGAADPTCSRSVELLSVRSIPSLSLLSGRCGRASGLLAPKSLTMVMLPMISERWLLDVFMY